MTGLDAPTVLAVIPARGGSKGIPRKNLVPFRGRPLLCHSIEQARAAVTIGRTIVSTEDDEIAAVARAWGAEVPFMRPQSLAEDHVLDLPVFRHVLDRLSETEGYRPDIVVHLRPTAPHREPHWIDESVRSLLADPAADSVRSVSPPREHPYRVFELNDRGYLDPIMSHREERPYLLRRQDLPEMYFYNCVIDVTRARTILEQDSMTGAAIRPFFMNADDVVDIDTERDLKLATALWGADSE